MGVSSFTLEPCHLGLVFRSRLMAAPYAPLGRRISAEAQSRLVVGDASSTEIYGYLQPHAGALP